MVAKRRREVYKQSVSSGGMESRGAGVGAGEMRLADPARQFKLIGPAHVRAAEEGSPASDE